MKKKTAKKIQITKLVIPTTSKSIQQVETFFYTINKKFHLNDEKFHALLVAVTEAVNNAIIHGNKNDEDKHITITCSQEGNILTIKIKDEGEGFHHDTLPNPLDEKNLLRIGGRGVFLMKAFMKTVSYNPKGNEVTMKMKIKD